MAIGFGRGLCSLSALLVLPAVTDSTEREKTDKTRNKENTTLFCRWLSIDLFFQFACFWLVGIQSDWKQKSMNYLNWCSNKLINDWGPEASTDWLYLYLFLSLCCCSTKIPPPGGLYNWLSYCIMNKYQYRRTKHKRICDIFEDHEIYVVKNMNQTYILSLICCFLLWTRVFWQVGHFETQVTFDSGLVAVRQTDSYFFKQGRNKYCQECLKIKNELWPIISPTNKHM